MTLKLKNTNFFNISPTSINDIDMNNVVVSNKFPFGKQDFKYFIGYKHNKEIRPFYIFFPEMSLYKRCPDNIKICILL